MDPRKLRKLLEILSEFGVKQYRTEDIQIELGVEKTSPPERETSPYSSAVDFDSEPSSPMSASEAISLGEEYSDEQMLHWSSGA